MFKKYMSFLLAIVMLLSLAACGKDKEPDPTNPQVEQTIPTPPEDNVDITEPDDNEENNDVTTPTEDEDNDDDGKGENKDDDDKGDEDVEPTEPEKEITYEWDVVYMDTPVYGALKMSTRDLTAGVRVNVAQTPFVIDLASLSNKMAENEYLKKTFTSLVAIKDHDMLASKYYKDTGSKISYIGREGYGAHLRNTSSPYYSEHNFEFGGRLNTADYLNYSSIYMTFTNIPKSAMNQDDIHTAASVFFDSEIADYLVYAEDFDNVDGNDKELGFGELYETIAALDDTRYFFERRIEDNGNGTYNLRFEVGVARNPNSNGANNTFSDMKPTYNTFSKSLKDVLPKSIGNNNDVTLFRDFASNYFMGLNQASQYTSTKLNKFDSMEMKQGKDSTYYNLDVEFGGTADNGDTSLLGVRFEYVETLGKMIYCKGSVSGTTYNFAKMMNVESQGQASVYKEVVKDVKNALSMLFPDADFGGISFNEGAIKNDKFTTSQSFQTVAFGKTNNAHVTVEVFTTEEGVFGQYTVTLSPML